MKNPTAMTNRTANMTAMPIPTDAPIIKILIDVFLSTIYFSSTGSCIKKHKNFMMV
jgi:hypothetical protein